MVRQGPTRSVPGHRGHRDYRHTFEGREPFRWTRRALLLLEKAPDAGDVLRQFVRQFSPHGGWSGSLAAIIESHEPLLDDLGAFANLTDVIAGEKVKLKKAIAQQRQWETATDKERDERFE